MWGRSFLNTTSPSLPPPASNALTAVGCHTIQLSSNSTYPKTASDASGEGLSPTRLPHFRCQSEVQAVNCASEQMAVNQRFTWPLPWVWLNLFKWLTELRKPVYSLDYLFITGYWRVWLSSQIKRGIGWDPNEHKSICPVEFRVQSDGKLGSFWFPKLKTPQTISFGPFMEASFLRRDWLNTTPLASWEIRGWVWGLKLLFMVGFSNQLLQASFLQLSSRDLQKLPH